MNHKEQPKLLIFVTEIGISESYEIGKPNKKLTLIIDYSFEKRLSAKKRSESEDGKDIPGLVSKIQEVLDEFLEEKIAHPNVTINTNEIAKQLKLHQSSMANSSDKS